MFNVELSDEYCKYNKMDTLNKKLQHRNILVLEKFYNDQIKMWLGVTTNVQIPIIQVFVYSIDYSQLTKRRNQADSHFEVKCS